MYASRVFKLGYSDLRRFEVNRIVKVLDKVGDYMPYALLAVTIPFMLLGFSLLFMTIVERIRLILTMHG